MEWRAAPLTTPPSTMAPSAPAHSRRQMLPDRIITASSEAFTGICALAIACATGPFIRFVAPGSPSHLGGAANFFRGDTAPFSHDIAATSGGSARATRNRGRCMTPPLREPTTGEPQRGTAAASAGAATLAVPDTGRADARAHPLFTRLQRSASGCRTGLSPGWGNDRACPHNKAPR